MNHIYINDIYIISQAKWWEQQLANSQLSSAGNCKGARDMTIIHEPVWLI